MRNKKIILYLIILAAVAGIFAAWRLTGSWRGAYLAFKNSDSASVDYLDQAGSFTADSSNSATSTAAGFPLRIPAGASLSLFAKDLNNPRSLARDCDGNLAASLTAAGQIVALPDKNADGRSDRTVTVLKGLSKPHGLAFFKTQTGSCRLYLASESEVVTYDYNPVDFTANFIKRLAELPSGGGHFTRSLLIYQDKLLVSVGSSCNVCREGDERRAAVLAMDLDGGSSEIFAKGLRNAVFMAINPSDGQVWATEMGRDNLGDDLPPDEINILARGKNYGWPNCYGRNIHDDEFDKNTYIRNPCLEPFETPSLIDLPAHSAPLGIAFFTQSWPKDLSGDALVALHGSWNRSTPTGYKIVRLRLSDGGELQGIDDFISGFLGPDGRKYGRPADIMIADGALYFSDDSAGVIYRLVYE